MDARWQPVVQTTVDHLRIRVYKSRDAMGAAAAAEVVNKMKEVQARKGRVRMVFAAAPSQNELLMHLCRAEGVDWSCVEVFHMDEYIGLPEDSPQRFSYYLQEHLFRHVHPGQVQLIRPDGDPERECTRYAQLLSEAPIDIVCLGIGENGHIAFNDPGVADFNDPAVVKSVCLDEKCRQQQVNDGCFPDLASVPQTALTLTVPALMSADHLIGVVPGPTKREAVRRALTGPVSEDCPASILRRHQDGVLYLDTVAYGVSEYAGD